MLLALLSCSGRETYLFALGKFKGRPFKDVLADPDYVQWLLDLASAPKCAIMRELRAYLKVMSEPPPPPAPIT